jgi:hypothetical protein
MEDYYQDEMLEMYFLDYPKNQKIAVDRAAADKLVKDKYPNLCFLKSEKCESTPLLPSSTEELNCGWEREDEELVAAAKPTINHSEKNAFFVPEYHNIDLMNQHLEDLGFMDEDGKKYDSVMMYMRSVGRETTLVAAQPVQMLNTWDNSMLGKVLKTMYIQNGQHLSFIMHMNPQIFETHRNRLHASIFKETVEYLSCPHHYISCVYDYLWSLTQYWNEIRIINNNARDRARENHATLKNYMLQDSQIFDVMLNSFSIQDDDGNVFENVYAYLHKQTDHIYPDYQKLMNHCKNNVIERGLQYLCTQHDICFELLVLCKDCLSRRESFSKLYAIYRKLIHKLQKEQKQCVVIK